MSLVLNQPFELLPIFRERVWGRTSLEPYFATFPVSEPIGEVWFTFNENQTNSGKSLEEIIASSPGVLGTAVIPGHETTCPLLVKLLFTTERLSVQVHPDDVYAAKHHGSLGKTEAWYVLDARPDGEVAVGFQSELTPDRFTESVGSGEIEDLLAWRKVAPGDIVYVPAGTVHAIGAGVIICEIQENSDITYRLYDYGRPRELHLEHGTQVSDLGPRTPSPLPETLEHGRDRLLRCDYFTIERLRPTGVVRFGANQPCYFLLICTGGSGTIAGESFSSGRTWFTPAHSAEFTIDGPGSEWILTYTASGPLSLWNLPPS